MTYQEVPLRDLVALRPGTRNPALGERPAFMYVDLDAVDRNTKAVAAPKSTPSQSAPSRARKIIRTNDVLVALVRPNLNAVAIVPPDLDDEIASTGFCVLRATERVLPEYLFYSVRSQRFIDSLCGLVSGAMYPAVSERQVLDQRIPVPPIVEQRRVVELLSRGESIVRMRREAELKAKEILPALFLDMFGDPATNPKGWIVRTLSEIAMVASGVAKGRRLNGRITRDVPYLRVANVQAGHLNLLEMKTIPATESEIAELLVKPGDILLTEGGDHDKLGRGALLDREIGECIHQNHVFRVRADTGAVIPEYFVSLLQTDMAKNYFLQSAKKTTNLASINMTQLRALPVAVPPMVVQTEFALKFKSCKQLEADQSRAGSTSAEAFQALLAGVFGTGQSI
jgi:type I restriction enzyme, S subunit